jgi:2-keto-3-deoxy-L-rhamnonate aldolase RhmA
MNWLKDKFDGNNCLNGIWMSAGSHIAAELAAGAGFDWALLDMEHGLGDFDSILRQIAVLTHTDCSAIVRVPTADSDAIGRVIDYGAAGVMAPMINTADEAKSFIQALRYPPEGNRGLTRSSRACRYGRDFNNYFQQANKSMTAIAQIETASGVANAEAIAAVDGVDVLFIGHSDLSLNLNCFEQQDSPVMQAAEDAVLSACVRHGKRAGMLMKAGMSIDHYRRKGFSIIALGSDVGCLKQGYEKLIK